MSVASIVEIVTLLESLTFCGGRLRAGKQDARDAVALLIMGAPDEALDCALAAMRHDGRWFSLAGLIGQWHSEAHTDEPFDDAAVVSSADVQAKISSLAKVQIYGILDYGILLTPFGTLGGDPTPLGLAVIDRVRLDHERAPLYSEHYRLRADQ